MKDETGNRYGRLTVIKYDHTDKRHGAYWLCSCDCGCTTVVKGNRLRNGKTKSCGCLKREWNETLGSKYAKVSSERMKQLNETEEHRIQAKEAATIHGGTGERLHRVWGHMKERCNNPNGSHATWYHDKGIMVCAEWEHDYAAFRRWAFENGYSDPAPETPFKDVLSIDRINPDLGYSPENCRWISVSENSRRRNQCHANQR